MSMCGGEIHGSLAVITGGARIGAVGEEKIIRMATKRSCDMRLYPVEKHHCPRKRPHSLRASAAGGLCG